MADWRWLGPPPGAQVIAGRPYLVAARIGGCAGRRPSDRRLVESDGAGLERPITIVGSVASAADSLDLSAIAPGKTWPWRLRQWSFPTGPMAHEYTYTGCVRLDDEEVTPAEALPVTAVIPARSRLAAAGTSLLPFLHAAMARGDEMSAVLREVLPELRRALEDNVRMERTVHTDYERMLDARWTSRMAGRLGTALRAAVTLLARLESLRGQLVPGVSVAPGTERWIAEQSLAAWRDVRTVLDDLEPDMEFLVSEGGWRVVSSLAALADLTRQEEEQAEAAIGEAGLAGRMRRLRRTVEAEIAEIEGAG